MAVCTAKVDTAWRGLATCWAVQGRAEKMSEEKRKEENTRE